MDNETINLLFKALISLLSILITGFLIPWLKNKIGEQKFAKIVEYTDLAIRTAEMIFTVEEWKEKKEYVLAYIIDKVKDVGIDLTAEDVNNLIESEVNRIKYSANYTKDKEA